MIEWLWQTIFVQHFDRIVRGEGYYDVIFFLTVIGACTVAAMWVLRKLGANKEADEWEKGIRDTHELAKRKGWENVLAWHRKFGYDKLPVLPESKPKANKPSHDLFLIGMGVAVALLALAVLYGT